MIDRCCEHARTLVEGIWRLDGSEVIWQPRINQGLVRFLDPRPGAHEEDHDRFTDIVIQRVLDSGEAFFMGTSWLGRRAMRVSVLNWQTSEADVDRAIAAIQRCLASARSAPATQAESSQGDGTL
jgi:glutamate/tyrosine decarboxylase-like PLP-dependent enzyme